MPAGRAVRQAACTRDSRWGGLARSGSPTHPRHVVARRQQDRVHADLGGWRRGDLRDLRRWCRWVQPDEAHTIRNDHQVARLVPGREGDCVRKRARGPHSDLRHAPRRDASALADPHAGLEPVSCLVSGRHRIAFATRRSIAVGDIFVVGIDGSGLRNVTGKGGSDDNWKPSWSPDGKKIVFESDRDGNAEIYLTDLDGGEVKRLTDDAANLDPSWSPDGTRIAFASNRDLNRSGKPNDEIYLIRSDGSGSSTSAIARQWKALRHGHPTASGWPSGSMTGTAQ